MDHFLVEHALYSEAMLDSHYLPSRFSSPSTVPDIRRRLRELTGTDFIQGIELKPFGASPERRSIQSVTHGQNSLTVV